MREALSILAPLGWLYNSGAALRRKAYARGLLKRHALRSPVISIGGLAVGGSMKTPAVIEIARALSARGPAVGVLGHGYRGLTGEPRVVSDGTHLLEGSDSVGDEAVLVAHQLPGCPVVTGKNKVLAGRLMEERFGKQILVVDSGFQHLPLFRDLDIVCVSEEDLGGRVLPAGFLRESPYALAEAQMILIDGETEGPRVAALRAQRPHDVHSVRRTDFGFFPFDGTGAEAQPPARAFVFCGIARPERFASDVAARGVEVVQHRFFRDHHRYTEAELKDIAHAAEKARASAVVVTVKDAVRIQTWPGTLPLLALSARLEIERLNDVLKRIDGVILSRMKAGR